MPRTLCKSNKPLYLNTFPSWKGRQPLRFFMMENLLEARRGSEFPTNGFGLDEEVNVFLAGMLTDFLTGKHDLQVKLGAECVLTPPEKHLSRRQRAEYYLANAHCRLLYLGLFDRGDPLRRQATPFGFTADESRQRDLRIGADCYRMAVNLLEDRNLVAPHVVEVWKKLAANFEGYVHVLAVMATRRLGLGANLSTGQLDRLMATDVEMDKEKNPPPLAPCDNPNMDRLLDQVLEYKKAPSPKKKDQVQALAQLIGIDPTQLLT